MVIPTANFLCFNSTGLNTIKADWIRNLYQVTGCEFVSIQEHFKKNKTIDKFFRDQFPEKYSYIIQGHRDKESDSGRPKGGIAQMYDKSLNLKVDRIVTKNFRIQAQILNFETSKLLWLNTYFPTDPGGEIFEMEELSELLSAIETVMDTVDFDDILWNGDLNHDPSRTSGFARTLSGFLSRLGLVTVWDKFPVDYTHVHTDFKSTSTLDHFVVNRKLLDHIVDCGVLHLGDNPSRHSPIMLKLNVGNILKLNKKEMIRHRKPVWYKADQMARDNFTMDLHNRLVSLVEPESLKCCHCQCQSKQHSEERDSFVLDILISVIEASHSCIPLSGGGRRRSDPSKSCQVSQCVPGWKDQVEPLRKDSVFWHALWKSADSPKQGELFQVMKRTRNAYHYAVRKVKKKADLIRAQKLLEASETSSTALLLEMKKIKGSKKDKSDLPDSVGGANGEINIVEKFCEVYEDLYNSAGSDEALDRIKRQLRDLIDNSEGGEDEVIKITGSVVKEAACKLDPGKGDITEGYTSDAILNAPDIVFEKLALVYRSWMYHGTVSLNLLSCAFLPLLKSNLKNPSEVNSYRAIAGSSLLLKLFDQVILLLWGHLLSTDPLQFGFKAGYSTTQCSWFVMEVASYFIKRGSPCIVTLLDCTKAFDKCRFDLLFSKLVQRKLPAVVIRVLIFVYQEQRAWVRWGQARSRSFGIVNGTRQGSVLSPALFSIYMDDLLVNLRRSGVGCHLGNVFCGAVGYADDLLLLAPSRSAMETMLSICEAYAAQNNIEFSTDPDPMKSKSKCIYMQGHMRLPRPINLKLYGVDLPWVGSATHLGHELSESCTMDLDMKQKRAQFINKSTEVRECFGFAQPNQVLQAVKTYCCSMYGAMIWSLFSNKAKEVFNSWNTCVKLAWGVPRTTHRYFVDNLLSSGIPSLKSSLLSCYMRFHESVLSSASLEVRLIANIASKDLRSTTGLNLHGIRKLSNLDSLSPASPSLVKTILLGARLEVPPQDRWRLPCLQKFLTEKHRLQAALDDTTEIDALIDSICSS